jgi:hypothetical protein
LPAGDKWVQLLVKLDKFDAVDKLIDGVAFLHEGGRVWWGKTELGTLTIWDNYGVTRRPEDLELLPFRIQGLKEGTKIRVLFEDRELTANKEWFGDDFRGQDLYQRYGGGYGVGYGNAPVALHIYEVEVK